MKAQNIIYTISELFFIYVVTFLFLNVIFTENLYKIFEENMKTLSTLVFILVLLTSQLFAQWQSANQGLYSGPIISIQADAEDVYIGTSSGMIYVSKDNGSSWIPKNKGLNLSSISAFAMSDNLMIATGYGNESIYISTDKGDNWVSQISELYAKNVIGFLIADSMIFATTRFNGVYLSLDNGSNWVSINNGIPYSDSMSKQFSLFYSLFWDGTRCLGASSTDGIYSYSLKDNMWSPLNKGIEDIPVRCIYKLSDKLLAGTKGFGLFESANNGLDWVKSSNDLDNITIINITSVGNKLLSSSEKGLWVSYNSGKDWKIENEFFSKMPIYNMKSTGQKIYISNNYEYFYCSLDSARTWFAKNGLNNYSINDIYTHGDEVFVATNGGVYLSTSKGDDWKSINEGIGIPSITAITANEQNLFCYSNMDSSVYSYPINNSPEKYWTKKSMLIDIRGMKYFNNYLFAFSPKKLYLSNIIDSVNTWEQVTLPDTNFYIRTIFGLNNRLYLGTSLGIYLSEDNGKTWVPKNQGLDFTDIYAIDYSNGILYTGSSKAVFVSMDLGDNWYPRYYPDKIQPTLSFAFDNHNNVFAAIRNGIYYSDASNINWSLSGVKDFTNNNINKILVSNGYIFSGTLSGLFRANILDFTDVENLENTHIDKFIYPLPTNSSISLQGILSEDSRYQIYNYQGFQVSDGITSNQTINVRNFLSGIYILKLNGKMYKFVINK